MPKEFVVGDTSYHFPDHYTDDQVQEILTKQGVIKPLPTTPTRSLGEQALDVGADVLRGVGISVLSPVLHTADFAARMGGGKGFIDNPYWKGLVTPQGTAQGVGNTLGTIGQFLLPGGLVTKAGTRIAGATAGMRAAPALNLAARAGLEAASAAGVTGLRTGFDPQAMRQAAATAGVTTGALGVAGEVIPKLAPALKESALAQYKRVLNPTKQGTKFLSQEQVAPGLLDRRVVAASLKTLQGKAAAQVQKWGQAIEDAFTNLPTGSAADLKSVTGSLDNVAEKEFTILNSATGELVPKGPQAKTALQNIDRLKQTLTDIAEVNPQTGALEVPVDNIRQLRQYFDKVAAKAGRYEGKTLSDQSIAEAHGLAADAIREELAKQFPDIAKINKEFAFWKNAQKVVDETVLRRTGQAKPLGRKLAGAAGTGAGFVTGGIPGAIVGKKVMDVLEQITTSTAWGTVGAVTKNELADALAKGQGAKVELLVRRIANSLGGAKATSEALQRFDAASQPALTVDVPGKASMQVYR